MDPASGAFVMVPVTVEFVGSWPHIERVVANTPSLGLRRVRLVTAEWGDVVSGSHERDGYEQEPSSNNALIESDRSGGDARGGTWALLAGGVLVVAGSLLPWLSVTDSLRSEYLSYWDTVDGKSAVGIGVVLVMAAAILVRRVHLSRPYRVVLWGVLAFGILLWGVDTVDMLGRVADAPAGVDVSAEFGIWVVGAGLVSSAVGLFLVGRQQGPDAAYEPVVPVWQAVVAWFIGLFGVFAAVVSLVSIVDGGEDLADATAAALSGLAFFVWSLVVAWLYSTERRVWRIVGFVWFAVVVVAIAEGIVNA